MVYQRKNVMIAKLRVKFRKTEEKNVKKIWWSKKTVKQHNKLFYIVAFPTLYYYLPNQNRNNVQMHSFYVAICITNEPRRLAFVKIR